MDAPTDPAAAVPPLGDVANRLLFDNDHVRVWEMVLRPGERSDRHRHDLPYVLCVLEGSAVDAEVETAAGTKHLHLPVQTGSVFFVPPGATETAVNNSGDRFREILIEFKNPPAGTPITVQTANIPPRSA
jgi:quercetin dioxygenase-like cupin family protein